MKKLIGILMILALTAAVLGCAALAEEFPQPEGGKKFESNWAIPNAMVEIYYEEEGYRVIIEAENDIDLIGAVWEYNCYYHEDDDALVSISSSKCGYTISEDNFSDRVYAEPEYEGFDEDGMSAVFTIDEHGCLVWLDPHENAGADLEFLNIGQFEGVWSSVEGEEPVMAEIMWNGATPDEWFYTVWLVRGDQDADTYTVTLANADYDPATGKLSGSGVMTVFTKNADGEYESKDEEEPVDIIFSWDENGKLIYEAGNGIEMEYSFLDGDNG